MSGKLTLKTLCLSLLLFCKICYADNLDTQVSRDKITLGETTTISYTYNGNANANSPNFGPLEKDFTITDTNYGNSFQMINGATTTQTFWRITVEPKRKGELIIPPITFGDLKSQEHKLIVTDAPSPISVANQNSPVFVEASVSNLSPYVQSEVIYTFKLFYQSQLEGPRIEIPQIRDVTMVQLGEGTQYQTTIKGKPFVVVEKNLAIFPQKAGKIEIAATHFRGVTFDTDPNMNSNPFYVATPRRLSLMTKAFTLNVQNIPAKFTGSTWLPAKDITLAETWSATPEEWQAGDPVIRTIIVEAQGLRSDQIPDLTIEKITGVNMYIDPPKRSNKIQNDMVTGVLEQKVTYIPNTSQAFTIPAIKLAWWNLTTNTSAITELKTQNIQVKGKIAATTPAAPAPAIVTDSAKPVAVSKAKTEPFYTSIWFWLSGGFLAIWLITIWLFMRKRSGPSIPAPAKPLPVKELTDENFAQACAKGDAALAQKFLLSWAKKHWKNIPPNLEKLREIIEDEDFKNALKELEQTMYAKKGAPWDGSELLSAYRKVKNQQKSGRHFFKSKTTKSDLLPPLNPN